MSAVEILWTPGMTLDALEKLVIQKAYRFFNENKTVTAQALGISIRTLDNKFEKYEAEDSAERDADAERRKQRTSFLERSRNGGAAPTEQNNGTASGKVHGGVSVESASDVAAKSAVSVPQRKEVQSVLPAQAAAGSARKSR